MTPFTIILPFRLPDFPFDRILGHVCQPVIWQGDIMSVQTAVALLSFIDWKTMIDRWWMMKMNGIPSCPTSLRTNEFQGRSSSSQWASSRYVSALIMLTFSFPSSFILKVLFLLSCWLRALWKHQRDLIAEIPLNLRLQNIVSLFPGMPTLLSVISQRCHRSTLCSMQMIVAGPRISVGKGCEKSVLQCLHKTGDWSLPWQEHPHVEISKWRAIWQSKRAHSTQLEGNQCLIWTAISFHTLFCILNSFVDVLVPILGTFQILVHISLFYNQAACLCIIIFCKVHHCSHQHFFLQYFFFHYMCMTTSVCVCLNYFWGLLCLCKIVKQWQERGEREVGQKQ